MNRQQFANISEEAQHTAVMGCTGNAGKVLDFVGLEAAKGDMLLLGREIHAAQKQVVPAQWYRRFVRG